MGVNIIEKSNIMIKLPKVKKTDVSGAAGQARIKAILGSVVLAAAIVSGSSVIATTTAEAALSPENNVTQSTTQGSLVFVPADKAKTRVAYHRSHQSHRSHYSHYSSARP